ncbi:glycerophosphodiester phosphodiesterase [Cytobacillus sp. Sa5YUA1]|uniref:Glycerophosphodiester phosphodiesterase n=1 Tax=Cytobacillus stercorigallinarum TaxID=2762240 RepID=A0ABR8QSK6_9BACI|nr:glycerophosphodiester phosphodiesterase [Cytobacillus stercorigallinarum]MBD7938257.1 glycerophosphodiester phosphodiesterase [Cytobacillus stercorigallinarum]
MIFAHRGLSGRFPENTMLAFEAARKAGVHGIELDVQLSKDGELVIIHDEKINRTTDGTGFIRDFKYKDIVQFDAGSWFDTEFNHARIPHLEEVFQWAKEDHNELVINVELKNDVFRYDGMEEKVLTLIEQYGLRERIILSSFNPESVKRIRTLDSEINTGYLILGIHANAIKVAQNIGADAIHCQKEFAQSIYGIQAIENKIPLRTYTINRWSDAQSLLNQGVEVVMTDFCDEFVSNYQ